MDSILSQNEIDSILNNINDGNVIEATDSIKNYDFKRPQRFSKEHFRMLERIHDNFATSMGITISMRVRTNVRMEVVSIEQLHYEEFIRSIPDPSFISAFNVHPLEGCLIIAMDIEMALLLFDILCGGKGELDYEHRPLTDIEMAILRNLMEGIVGTDLKESWSEVIDINPKLDFVGSSAGYIQQSSNRDAAALITLSIDIKGHKGYVSLCIPYGTLQPVLSKLISHQFDSRSKKGKKSVRETVGNLIEKVDFPIEVILGDFSVSTSELLGLEHGDVIPLKTKVDDKVKVQIGGKTKMTAVPGLSNGFLSIKILDRCGDVEVE